jgi:hypothetical protein
LAKGLGIRKVARLACTGNWTVSWIRAEMAAAAE